MANLETLELQINGSAERASKGIDRLIDYLSRLSGAISAPYDKLVNLRQELEKIANLKLPNIGNIMGTGSGDLGKTVAATNKIKNNMNSVAKSVKATGVATASFMYPLKNGGYTNLNSDFGRALKGELGKEKGDAAWATAKDYFADLADLKRALYSMPTEGSKVPLFGSDAGASKEATSGMKELTSEMEKTKQKTEETTKSLKEVDSEMKQKKPDAEAAAGGMKKLQSNMKNVTTTAKNATKHMSLFSRITRIATTMMIRSGIRAFISATKQGLDNYYQYSKLSNGQFAQSMDKMAGTFATLRNSLGAAIAPALAAIIPVLINIANAAMTAFNAINMLISLLSGKSTWSKAKDMTQEYATSIKSAAGGAGSAVKEMLASFDELNVIANESGGGGGGGASVPDYSSMFEEVELPEWLQKLQELYQEWKPLIDAVLTGVLGAILLPKIFEWLSKIFGLFDGKKKNFDLGINVDGDLKDLVDDLKEVTTQATLAAAALGAVTEAAKLAKKALDELLNFDWKKILLLLLPALASIVASIVSTLAAALSNLSTKLTVDREEFDKLKEDIEEFKKNNKIIRLTVMFDSSYMDFVLTKKSIDKWAEDTPTKHIAILFDRSYMDYAIIKKEIDKWVKETPTKYIAVMFDRSYMDYAIIRNGINDWVKDTPTKYVAIAFDSSYITYMLAVTGINLWVNNTPTKKIKIAFDSMSYAAFTAIATAVTVWANTVLTKIVRVGFSTDSFNNFWAIADSIDAWANETLTKIVNVVVNQQTKTTSTNTKVTVPAPGAGIVTETNGTNSTNKKTYTNIFGKEITNPISVGFNEFIDEVFTTPIKKLLGIEKANGAYGIPAGDLFIANEAGAELVGSINGKTSVANQSQIIEGISGGVERANAEQNRLLREQNELLRGILEKDNSVRFGASAALGRIVNQSQQMYAKQVGG